MSKCEICGSLYMPRKYSYGQKYCSPRCNDIAKIRRSKQLRKKKGIEQIGEKLECEYCGKKFIKKSPTGKFCSIDCQYGALYNRLKRKRLKKGIYLIGDEIFCKECGKKFIKKCSTGKFCSRKCRNRNKDKNMSINRKIRSRLSSRLWNVLKTNGEIKKNSVLKYLGCSVEEFKNHLSSLFYSDDMNFDNYGSVWHIDHIKPCSSFNLSNEEEIYECFNYKNLQPLHAKINLMKSDKIKDWDESELNHAIYVLRYFRENGHLEIN